MAKVLLSNIYTVNNRCNLHPHPSCLYGEDEEDCFQDYKRKGLVSQSAHFSCTSPIHNIDSPPILSTVFDYSIGKFKYDVTIISQGATVGIQAIKCDGILQCFKGIDEFGCRQTLEERLMLKFVGNYFSFNLKSKPAVSDEHFIS